MKEVKLEELAGDARRICITGHLRPDGDCVGGCLAVRNYLLDTDPTRQVDVYLEPSSKTFSFLRGYDTIRLFDGEDYDACFVLDVSDQPRLGKNGGCPDHSKKVYCIDHHVTNQGYGDVAVIHPESAAICELLFDMMEEEKISKETAECRYLGIAHDTGVFKHSNVTKRTMEVSAVLGGKGVDTSKIANETYFMKTYLQNQLLGRALVESLVFCDGQCIVSMISKKMQEFYGAKDDDLEGIVDSLRTTEGVECAIFVIEQEPQVMRISLRSNNRVDVSRVAAYFGGGGHVRAAGCTITGSFYDVVNNLSRQIMLQLEN